MTEALDIDLYQARMLIAFYKSGMSKVTGTMDAFTRKLPANRSFLVVCGVDRVIEYLQNLKFTIEDINTLKEVLPDVEFTTDLEKYLLNINFAKDLKVRAMADGEIAFACEPIVSILGPIGIAQYVEKRVLSILNHDIRIASKAARVYLAAQGKSLAEFGGRRGPDTITAEAARAAYIAGFSHSSSVQAFAKYGVPCLGTMGHVWVMAHLDEDGNDGEKEAYKHWSNLFKNSTYLPDTYNTRQGVRKILETCRSNIGGIRLDSGNLKEDSFAIRRELNNHDAFKTTIGATNDLDEYQIKELLDYGCPFDWFGVGTQVVSTPDAPTCNFIYKLVDVHSSYTHYEYVAKIAADGKGTLPGPKQVYRYFDEKQNMYTHDVLSIDDGVEKNKINGALHQPLLATYDLEKRTNKSWTAQDARNYFINTVNRLPPYLKLISRTQTNIDYPVEHHPSLIKATEKFLMDKRK